MLYRYKTIRPTSRRCKNTKQKAPPANMMASVQAFIHSRMDLIVAYSSLFREFNTLHIDVTDIHVNTEG